MITRRSAASGLAATLALACSRPLAALPEPRSPGVTRRYLDGAFGQLHLRVAAPETGAIAAPPLVLFHQTALSGRMFDRFLPLVSQDRLAIAVDTPGYGESDRPDGRPTLQGYGDAILDALLAEFGGPFDLIGYHTGAAIAADLAARREAVDRTVLVSIPYFGAERRQSLVARISEPDEPGGGLSEDGSHLLPMWRGTFGVSPPGQSIEDVARLVAEKQRAGSYGEWALLSALEANLDATLAAIRGPVLVVAPHDGLEDECRAAANAIAGSRLLELPAHAYGLFDAAAAEIAEPINRFLAR